MKAACFAERSGGPAWVIELVEHLFRWTNWTITEKSQEFEKTNAQTIEFRVPLKPDEEKIVTYQVHYTW